MRIGVFDSGKGGEFIADGLKQLLPHHEFIVINDRKNVPYGSRTNDEIIVLTEQALQPLYGQCPIIVIACNTATMAAISTLRLMHPETLFVGVEPMIKPSSSISNTKHVTVLATPLTLLSQRYQQLKENFGRDLVIDEPNTNHWARHIEFNAVEHINFEGVKASIASGSDTIILACTHYLQLKDQLQQISDSVTILEPTEAIARQIQRLDSLAR